MIPACQWFEYWEFDFGRCLEGCHAAYRLSECASVGERHLHGALFGVVARRRGGRAFASGTVLTQPFAQVPGNVARHRDRFLWVDGAYRLRAEPVKALEGGVRLNPPRKTSKA